MNSLSPLNSAYLGIQRGLDGLKKDAAEIASARNLSSDKPTDVLSPLVHLIQDRTQVAISAKVIKAVDAALGSLLDVKA